MDDFQRKLSNKIKKSAREYSEPLPADLLIDIFSRVPSKSIARFRCVSKYWGSILRCPYFTELFLTKSSSRPSLFFMVRYKDNKSLFYSPQPQNLDKNCSVVATRYNTTFPKYVSSDMWCSNSVMVCGLVFSQANYERKVQVICNHATGEFLTLPRVTNPKANAGCIEYYYFGYDPINKKFKVLCMNSSSTQRVLTLETGKCKRTWRSIECKPHSPLPCQICINGVLYYPANFEGSSIIVSFDVRSEKFGFINNAHLPIEQHVWGLGPYRWTLINYKGKLGTHTCAVNYMYSTNFVLWVLEDAENHKWSRRVYALSRPQGEELIIKRFVGMTYTGEIVFSSGYPSSNTLYIYFYNIESNIFTRVDVRGFEGFDGLVSIFLDYVENMVRLI